jgi:hypothetical protein
VLCTVTFGNSAQLPQIKIFYQKDKLQKDSLAENSF